MKRIPQQQKSLKRSIVTTRTIVTSNNKISVRMEMSLLMKMAIMTCFSTITKVKLTSMTHTYSLNLAICTRMKRMISSTPTLWVSPSTKERGSLTERMTLQVTTEARMHLLFKRCLKIKSLMSIWRSKSPMIPLRLLETFKISKKQYLWENYSKKSSTTNSCSPRLNKI